MLAVRDVKARFCPRFPAACALCPRPVPTPCAHHDQGSQFQQPPQTYEVQAVRQRAQRAIQPQALPEPTQRGQDSQDRPPHMHGRVDRRAGEQQSGQGHGNHREPHGPAPQVEPQQAQGHLRRVQVERRQRKGEGQAMNQNVMNTLLDS